MMNFSPSMLFRLGVLSLSFFLSFSSHANDGDRVTLLEKEVQSIKQRLLQLESSIQSTPRPLANTSSEGWKHLPNWRSLKREMTLDQVRALLGEPMNISGGYFTRWTYPNRGSVVFREDRLDSWTEPR